MCAHHRTLETLEMSAAQGFHICQAFWLQVSETEQDALRAAETKRLLATPGRPPEKPEPDNLQEYFEWLTFTLLLKEPWGLGVDYVLMLKFSGEGIDWKSVSPKDTLALGLHTFQICYKDPDCQPTQAVKSYSTDSDESWATAMTWFDQCVKTHVKCNPKRDRPAWYPKRLLGLGSGQNGNQTVRLIQTADEAMSGPYVTLSHCWGKSQFIQLNKNTSASLRSGVSIEVMPKTFREAILTTKRFGTRYIWIDSMCIQQALDADTYIRKIEAQGRQVDRDIACYEIWNKIISAYSETLLTVASDKLIALSGIAKHMRPSVNNDTYVAGLTHETQDRWRMLVNNVLVRPQDDNLPNRKRIGPLVHLDVPATDDAFVHDMTQQRLFFMVARTPKSDDEYIPILLLRLCDAERRLFERIGIATGGPKSGTEMLLAELDEETTASLSCFRYEKGLHTVRII
ncbi:unnamed protein product [Alternaria alternata]